MKSDARACTRTHLHTCTHTDRCLPVKTPADRRDQFAQSATYRFSPPPARTGSSTVDPWRLPRCHPLFLLWRPSLPALQTGQRESVFSTFFPTPPVHVAVPPPLSSFPFESQKTDPAMQTGQQKHPPKKLHTCTHSADSPFPSLRPPQSVLTEQVGCRRQQK